MEKSDQEGHSNKTPKRRYMSRGQTTFQFPPPSEPIDDPTLSTAKIEIEIDQTLQQLLGKLTDLLDTKSQLTNNRDSIEEEQRRAPNDKRRLLADRKSRRNRKLDEIEREIENTRLKLALIEAHGQNRDLIEENRRLKKKLDDGRQNQEGDQMSMENNGTDRLMTRGPSEREIREPIMRDPQMSIMGMGEISYSTPTAHEIQISTIPTPSTSLDLPYPTAQTFAVQCPIPIAQNADYFAAGWSDDLLFDFDATTDRLIPDAFRAISSSDTDRSTDQSFFMGDRHRTGISTSWQYQRQLSTVDSGCGDLERGDEDEEEMAR